MTATKWIFIFRPKAAAPIPTSASSAQLGFLSLSSFTARPRAPHPGAMQAVPPSPRGPAAVQKTKRRYRTRALFTAGTAGYLQRAFNRWPRRRRPYHNDAAVRPGPAASGDPTRTRARSPAPAARDVEKYICTCARGYAEASPSAGCGSSPPAPGLCFLSSCAIFSSSELGSRGLL